MVGKVLVLNGPNLNMLGTREPDVYGHETLGDIEQDCATIGKDLDFLVEFRQTNTEGELVSWVQQAKGDFDALIVNAGAYTHTSVALLDALKAVNLPTVEVHLSNLHQREDFRHNSYVSKAAQGMICGFGGFGYTLGLRAIAKMLNNK